MSGNINKTQQKKWKIFSKINENLLSKFFFWYGSTSKFHMHKNQYLRKIPLKVEKKCKKRRVSGYYGKSPVSTTVSCLYLHLLSN